MRGNTIVDNNFQDKDISKRVSELIKSCRLLQIQKESLVGVVLNEKNCLELRAYAVWKLKKYNNVNWSGLLLNIRDELLMIKVYEALMLSPFIDYVTKFYAMQFFKKRNPYLYKRLYNKKLLPSYSPATVNKFEYVRERKNGTSEIVLTKQGSSFSIKIDSDDYTDNIESIEQLTIRNLISCVIDLKAVLTCTEYRFKLYKNIFTLGDYNNKENVIEINSNLLEPEHFEQAKIRLYEVLIKEHLRNQPKEENFKLIGSMLGKFKQKSKTFENIQELVSEIAKEIEDKYEALLRILSYKIFLDFIATRERKLAFSFRDSIRYLYKKNILDGKNYEGFEKKDMELCDILESGSPVDNFLWKLDDFCEDINTRIKYIKSRILLVRYLKITNFQCVTGKWDNKDVTTTAL